MSNSNKQASAAPQPLRLQQSALYARLQSEQQERAKRQLTCKHDRIYFVVDPAGDYVACSQCSKNLGPLCSDESRPHIERFVLAMSQA